LSDDLGHALDDHPLEKVLKSHVDVDNMMIRFLSGLLFWGRITLVVNGHLLYGTN
jgi:hypothetical protein